MRRLRIPSPAANTSRLSATAWSATPRGREGSLISLTGLVTADAPLIRRWCRASIQIGRVLSLRFSEGPSADQADYQLSGVHLTGDE